MKKLCIVVPVFRAKKTLFRLLDSIAKSDIAENAFLVLVFDCDGIDYREEISYISSRIDTKTVFLDKNLGSGLARQAGIDNSKSEYIMFADADDYYYPKALNKVVSSLSGANFDVLLSSFRYERDGEVKIISNNMTWLHGKIYRRDFLIKNKIHFNSYRYNEDNGFNRLILLYEPRLAFNKTVTYVYSENKDSITRRNDREYKFTGLEFLAKNLVWAAKEYLNNCKECNFSAFAALLFSLLLSMYYYYLEFYDVYEVKKILLWTKEGQKLYEKYSGYLDEGRRDHIVKEYKDAYFNSEEIISFNDFLAEVESA